MSPRTPSPGVRAVLLRALLSVAALVVCAGCGPELGPVVRLGAIPGAGLPETSDPYVVRVDHDYFVYGSNNNRRAPVTWTREIYRARTLSQKDLITSEAMPTPVPWSSRPAQLWAPTVAPFAGGWVMFFSADRRNPPQPHNPQCVGRATAPHPLGPFTPEPQPFTCGLGGVGGALDPEVFTAPGGERYLLVAFSDTETPIHSIPLDAWGASAGNPVAILGRRHPWEHHFIENPSMTFDPTRGDYLLAYSAGRWWEFGYSTGIARCSTPLGPCTSDPGGPWIAASNGRSGPGGLSFFDDPVGSRHLVFSTFQAGWESTSGGRSATVMPLTLQPAVAAGPIAK